LEQSGTTRVGTVIVNQGKVVRPSQLIASVGRTQAGSSMTLAVPSGYAAAG